MLRIPKTGSTAVITALGHAPHLSHHNLSEDVHYTDYFRFCFVRHPFDRFESAYNYSVMMAADGKINQTVVRERIVEFQLDRNINDFIKHFSESDPKVLKRNLHFRPQMWWLSRKPPSFIGRYESLSSDFARLTRLIGADDCELTVMNRSRSVGPPISEHNRSWLGRLYRADFRFLGYAR